MLTQWIFTAHLAIETLLLTTESCPEIVQVIE